MIGMGEEAPSDSGSSTEHAHRMRLAFASPRANHVQRHRVHKV